MRPAISRFGSVLWICLLAGMGTMSLAVGAQDEPVVATEEALREIFSRADYAGLDTEDASVVERVSQIDRVMGQFWAWIVNTLRKLRALRTTAPLAYWAILVGLLVVLALLVWHIVYVLRRAFSASSPDDDQREAEAERMRRSSAFLADADDEAERGSFAEALRSLLLAAFARYAEDRESLVPVSKTNREVLARLPLDEDGARELRWLVGSVDRSWYGTRPAARADFDRGRALVAPLVGRRDG